MIQPKKYPDRLYTYKSVDAKALELLIRDQLYFSNPETFNDPLDTNPCVDGDLDVSDLAEVVRSLVVLRMASEVQAIVGEAERDCKAQIRRQCGAAADEVVCEHWFQDGFDGTIDPKQIWIKALKRELLKRYNGGVMCFSTQKGRPLMWSHYADKHRGICIGYSVPINFSGQLFPVDYDGNRTIKASDLTKMLEGDRDAKACVDRIVLLPKGPAWKYEREWRLIGNRGAQTSSLDLEEITFGVRCNSATRYAVARALKERSDRKLSPIKYYEMCETDSSFKLKRKRLKNDELLSLEYVEGAK